MGEMEKTHGNTLGDTTENVMNIEIEGLTEKEVREVQKIFARFMKKYKENPKRETVEWLADAKAAAAVVYARRNV